MTPDLGLKRKGCSPPTGLRPVPHLGSRQTRGGEPVQNRREQAHLFYLHITICSLTPGVFIVGPAALHLEIPRFRPMLRH